MNLLQAPTGSTMPDCLISLASLRHDGSGDTAPHRPAQPRTAPRRYLSSPSGLCTLRSAGGRTRAPLAGAAGRADTRTAGRARARAWTPCWGRAGGGSDPASAVDASGVRCGGRVRTCGGSLLRGPIREPVRRSWSSGGGAASSPPTVRSEARLVPVRCWRGGGGARRLRPQQRARGGGAGG